MPVQPTIDEFKNWEYNLSVTSQIKNSVETQTESRYVLIEYICKCCKKISVDPDYISPLKIPNKETEDFIQLEYELNGGP